MQESLCVPMKNEEGPVRLPAEEVELTGPMGKPPSVQPGIGEFYAREEKKIVPLYHGVLVHGLQVQ